MKIAKCKYAIEEWCCPRLESFVKKSLNRVKAEVDEKTGKFKIREDAISFCPFCDEKIEIIK